MKKPKFLPKVLITGLIVFLLAIAVMIVVVDTLTTRATSRVMANWPEWKIWIRQNIDSNDFLIVWLPLMFLLLMIWIIWFGIAYKKENQWYWEHYKNRIASVKVKAIGINHKSQLNDLNFPRDGKQIIKFSADYQGKIGWKDIELKSDDPDLDFLLDKIDNPKLVSDKHITKTKVLAVNNDTVTYTNGGISIGGAVIGGLIAGDVGAILGGLSGSKYSQTQNGENIYTFLVCYDDRPPETEKVKESDRRFKFLISKFDIA